MSIIIRIREIRDSLSKTSTSNKTKRLSLLYLVFIFANIISLALIISSGPFSILVYALFMLAFFPIYLILLSDTAKFLTVMSTQSFPQAILTKDDALELASQRRTVLKIIAIGLHVLIILIGFVILPFTMWIIGAVMNLISISSLYITAGDYLLPYRIYTECENERIKEGNSLALRWVAANNLQTLTSKRENVFDPHVMLNDLNVLESHAVLSNMEYKILVGTINSRINRLVHFETIGFEELKVIYGPVQKPARKYIDSVKEKSWKFKITKVISKYGIHVLPPVQSIITLVGFAAILVIAYHFLPKPVFDMLTSFK